jgi:hypothetical protein
LDDWGLKLAAEIAPYFVIANLMRRIIRQQEFQARAFQ